jgi:hypothetical protein
VFHSQADITEIGNLIRDIQSGKISRNKNYYTLARMDAYQRFKRAKLLISLLDDINKTAAVAGNEIILDQQQDCVEISLSNPQLKYNRKATITLPEFNLIRSQLTTFNLNDNP